MPFNSVTMAVAVAVVMVMAVSRLLYKLFRCLQILWEVSLKLYADSNDYYRWTSSDASIERAQSEHIVSQLAFHSDANFDGESATIYKSNVVVFILCAVVGKRPTKRFITILSIWMHQVYLYGINPLADSREQNKSPAEKNYQLIFFFFSAGD